MVELRLVPGTPIQVQPAAHVETGVFPHLIRTLFTPTHVQSAASLSILSSRLD